MGGSGYGGGGRGRVYAYRYTVTTRTTCIKMGSDESYFKVSLIVRDKVTRPCPQTTTFEEKGEPKRYRTEVLPLTSLTARPNRLSHKHSVFTAPDKHIPHIIQLRGGERREGEGILAGTEVPRNKGKSGTVASASLSPPERFCSH